MANFVDYIPLLIAALSVITLLLTFVMIGWPVGVGVNVNVGPVEVGARKRAEPSPSTRAHRERMRELEMHRREIDCELRREARLARCGGSCNCCPLCDAA